MSDIAVQLVDPEDNSQHQYPRTLAQLVVTSSGSDVETELGKKYEKPSGGIPATDLASGVIPTVPSAATNVPLVDGTAAVGSSSEYAKEDHVHPTDTSRASSTHTHGNITNDGKLQTTDVAPASGDKLVIVDNSNEGDGKIARSNITFGSDTTKFLRNDGTWDTPSGGGTSGVNDVKIVWGSGSSAQASTVANNISSIYVHGTYSPTNNQKVATLKVPTGTTLSGSYITKYNSSTGNLELCTSYSDNYLRVGASSNSFNQVGLLNFGGIVIGSGLGLSYDSSTHIATITNNGAGASYSQGDGINITTESGVNYINVTPATAFAVATPVIGGVLPAYAANPTPGYCNTIENDIVAVPIFYGSIEAFYVRDADHDYKQQSLTHTPSMHYVDVRAIADAICDNSTMLCNLVTAICKDETALGILKEFLGL